MRTKILPSPKKLFMSKTIYPLTGRLQVAPPTLYAFYISSLCALYSGDTGLLALAIFAIEILPFNNQFITKTHVIGTCL